MISDRHLVWEGCWNARDLGGLRLCNGGRTRWGTTVRMDSPQRLTGQAWQEIWDYGIRTVIDLRNAEEIRPDGRPAGMTTVQVPLDQEKDPDFVLERGLDCTPLYYPPFLERYPNRVADVFRAIAAAGEGGLVYHCAAGRDRTGVVTWCCWRSPGSNRPTSRPTTRSVAPASGPRGPNWASATRPGPSTTCWPSTERPSNRPHWTL